MSFFVAPQETYKDAVRVASTGNITLSGLQSVDGVALSNGDRVLCKDQTNPVDNGVYNAHSTAWGRTADLAQPGQFTEGHIVNVEEGNNNGRTQWRCTTLPTVTIGTTHINYTRETPPYGGRERNPWSFVNLQDNLDRQICTSYFTPTTGTMYLFGGSILRAGVTYTNMYFYFGNVAAATITGIWAGLVKMGTGPGPAQYTMLASSANSTAVPAQNNLTGYAIAGGYKPDFDLPVWVALSITAGTVPNLAATPASTNNMQAATPILAGSSNTGQGATPIAAGTVVTAPTSITQNVYVCFS